MGRSRSRLAAIVLLIALSTAAHAVELPKLSQPNWSALSEEQKQVLAPLAADWDQMDSVRRKKWLGVASRYSSMSAEEQMRMQSQMREWAKLTPLERKLARDKYKQLRQAPPEKKATVKQQWAAYQELPEDERQRLHDAARTRMPPKVFGLQPPHAKPALTPMAAVGKLKLTTSSTAAPSAARGAPTLSVMQPGAVRSAHVTPPPVTPATQN